MKIACIGNMNNNMFALVRHLRSRNFDCELILLDEMEHFLPQYDTFNNDYKKFTFQFKWEIINFYTHSKNDILNQIKKYDFLIGCHTSPAFIEKSGRKLDIFIPYGGDLYDTPFIYNKSSLKNYKIKEIYNFFVWNSRKIIFKNKQKKGIQSAFKIISNTNWKHAQDAINRLNCKAVNIPRIMVFKEKIPKNILEKYSWINNYDFVVFSPTRHAWKSNNERLSDFKENGGSKRNDKLIKAFDRIIKKNKFKNPLLIFCEYGLDTEHSKKLIKELKINNNVKWLPLLPRKEIIAIISKITFVADQFRIGMCGTSAGITNEALAYGKPVITNTDKAIFNKDDPYYGSEILEALSENDIFEYFLDYSKNSDKYKEIGRRSSEWFNQNIINKPLNFIINEINEKQKYLENNI